MQNVPRDTGADETRLEKVNVQHDIGNISSTPQSTNSTPNKSETETLSLNQRLRRLMSETSESEEDSVSEVEAFMVEQEYDDEPQAEAAKFLLGPDEDRNVDPETQARLEALLQAAGIGQLAAKDGKALGDPEVLRRLTSSVSCALDEAAAALNRMRSDTAAAASSSTQGAPTAAGVRPATQGGAAGGSQDKTSLIEACTDGDVGTVKKLLTEGRSVHETSEEGESLLSLACSAGYFELAQVLLAMHANVEDRGIKGECTPLMEAASAGHLDIVRLLVHHGADVNAQSTSGNTPLMYACAGGHTEVSILEEVVKFLLENGANVEDHNENGHTPLMEAASAGHVALAKILLMHGAGINTHSNEFKESALTLACYKGHLDMVRFLLEAGADQEHKTDEMHTALMEASMDGHVEVARLLLDSGAQVNMPTDSFESPLTLAACGGHVDLAMLLIERGANIEEVNDEGYTPLMEAAREGHEEMVHLLLGQGANINAQTDETQETALTLACCGGFTEVADILLKGGADIELGASTPLMEASQEGHLELVRFLLEYGANVNAVTQTNDTALTYACENGHTDVAELLIQYGADIEHESEGGRTPLMKACRAGHLCTVKFLIDKGANVRKQTTNNDHTPLSLACAGGHLSVVQLLLENNADPNHKLKDNSTMLIEAAKGGHTNVVQLLLDYPHSMLLNSQQQGAGAAAVAATAATNLSMLPGQVGGTRSSPAAATMAPAIAAAVVGAPFFQPPTAVLQEVPEAVRIVQDDDDDVEFNPPKQQVQSATQRTPNEQPQQQKGRKLLAKSRSTGAMFDGTLTSAEAQQVRTPPLSDFEEEVISGSAAIEYLNKEDPNSTTLIEFIKKRKQFCDPDGNTQKQQILEELHRVERELHGKHQQQQQQQQAAAQQQAVAAAAASHNHVFQYQMPPQQDPCVSQSGVATPATALAPVLNFDLAIQQQKQQGLGYNSVLGAAGQQPQLQVPFYAGIPPAPQFATPSSQAQGQQTTAPAFYFTPMPASSAQVGVTLGTPTATVANGGLLSASAAAGLTVKPTLVPASSLTAPLIKLQSVADVSQNTAINDRPKVKPIKKEGKNIRKLQQLAQQQAHQQQQQQQQQQQLQHQNSQVTATNQNANQSQQPQQVNPIPPKNFCNIFADQQSVSMFRQLQMPHPSAQQQRTGQTPQSTVQFQKVDGATPVPELLNVQDLDVTFLKDEQQENLLTASILQQFHNTSIPLLRAAAAGSPQKTQLEVYDPLQQDPNSAGKVTKLELSEKDFPDDMVPLEVQPYPGGLDETMIASITAQQHADLQAAAVAAAAASGNTADLSRVEYFAVPAGTTGAGPAGQVPVHALYPLAHTQHYLQGFQAGYSLKQQQLADSLSVAGSVAQSITSQQQTYVAAQPQPCVSAPPQQVQQVANCGHVTQGTHICQPCGQHQQPPASVQQQLVQQQQQAANQQLPQTSNQVQAATQTQTAADVAKKIQKVSDMKFKKGRVIRHQYSSQNNPQSDPNYQIDHNSAITQYSGAAANQQRQCAGANSIISPCMDVDSETESNHDTALTLACAGGHEELVELLISRGADIEHRDKKGFTPLILAATAGHEKVVEILLNHNADIEAQSERTKDTPLSLACSGGRYEVVELLLNRNANKEHRNVSDYTPLSLAASGGYVNIIKLLLNHGAEINSRTGKLFEGSKLGISPLMLAAMNGHGAAVKLLLDSGSDINAQIETNRNTALTLACFQGRHEVVALLLDRKANVEHRAKTGLTPLMEAASGGYVDVGRVLLDKGADVNATPVPSSRDTALTIAADKGHVKFVELLLDRGAQVEVKNKKGNSPLWLAANGGHLPVIELLYAHNADIDSQDNRKVSCLMAAFRKGHVRVAKWMVHHVTQYPSDQEMARSITTVSDKELLEKCHECVRIIRAAKETQAAKANKNASILLEELESERTREESKRLQAAKRRERKKKKRLEKKEQHKKLLEENQKNETYDDSSKKDEKEEAEDTVPEVSHAANNDKEEGDSGIDANSLGSCSSNDIKTPKEKRKNKKNKKGKESVVKDEIAKSKASTSKETLEKPDSKESKETKSPSKSLSKKPVNDNIALSMEKPRGRNYEFDATKHSPADRDDFKATGNENYVTPTKNKKSEDCLSPPQGNKAANSVSPKQNSKREEGWKEVVRKSSVQAVSESGVKKVSVPLNAISRVIGRGGSNINAIRQYTGALIEVEKQSKGQGERIITIKGTPDITKQAHNLITTLIKDPEVDIMSILPKSSKAATSTTTLWDKTQIATKKNAGKLATVIQSVGSTQPLPSKSQVAQAITSSVVRFANNTSVKFRQAPPTVGARVSAPRLITQSEKNVVPASQSNPVVRMPTSTAPPSRSTAAKIITTTASQTFAAKLTETVSVSQAPVGVGMNGPNINMSKPRAALGVPNTSNSGSVSPQPPITSLPSVNIHNSPSKHVRPAPAGSAPPTMQHFQPPMSKPQPPQNPQASASFGNCIQTSHTSTIVTTCVSDSTTSVSTTMTNLPSANQAPIQQQTILNQSPPQPPQQQQQLSQQHQQPQEETKIPKVNPTSEYTLFTPREFWREQEQQKIPNFASVAGGGANHQNSVQQHKFIDQEPPPQVDLSKAPGYRAPLCSPVSSKPSSNSTTPPNMGVSNNYPSYQQEPSKPPNTLPPIGSRPQVSQQNNVPNDFIPFMDFKANNALPTLINLGNEAQLLQNFNAMQVLNYSQPQPPVSIQPPSMSRLNPKAPEYSSSVYNSMPGMQSKNAATYNGFQMNMQSNMFDNKAAMQVGNMAYNRGAGLGANSSQNRSWMGVPHPPFTQQQQNELISGIAGMTIQTIQAKVYSSEGLENGGELAGIVNNSPNMSPNIAGSQHGQHGLHPDNVHFGMEDRKPPPIGTERARKAYNTQMEQNWSGMEKQSKWGGNGLDQFGMRQAIYPEDTTPLDYHRPLHMDNFMNAPPYFNHQIPNLRQEFIPDMSKLDLTWENARPMTDLQDKPHSWTNHWNK
ncbi:ankyrin repeat and KH domain-containing protein 1-like isoform X2 [Anthonomus grandis grandis]|uniref:ankyrin repeat and KH domain-containing protein 1-like isoform X2 n=1 Tax=Anthonomus grandis grandis TaxID=2921223 RepID=UPI0021663C64|nr:ankyrin repeat and KH domain-containing protein 1-like isoform X2 [Anthonomus grandis grandis]